MTGTAGMLDALSYLGAHVFTANMTGNTVLLGIHLVQGDGGQAVPPLLALLAFVGGALLGSLIVIPEPAYGQWSPSTTRAVLIESLFLAAFALLWSPLRTHGGHLPLLLVVIASAALGLQSAAVRHLHIAGVVTTFITGTITTGVVGFVRSARGAATSAQSEHEEKHSLLLAALFADYVAGAALAAFLNARLPLAAVIAPLLLVLLVLVFAPRRGFTSLLRPAAES